MNVSACCGLAAGEPCRCHTDADDLARAVHGFVARRVRDKNDADDIAQDALLRLYGSVDTLRDAGALEGWAFQIARTAVVDHYRRRAKQPSPSDPVDLPEEALDEDSDAARADLGACVSGLMDRIPDRYRLALQLADVDGMTQQQAGAALGLSTSGVKSRVQRGRRMLRDQVAHCCDIALDSQGAVADLAPRRPGADC
jgi:RNA polymerase sigma-70 factor, ECF subfamily